MKCYHLITVKPGSILDPVTDPKVTSNKPPLDWQIEHDYLVVGTNQILVVHESSNKCPDAQSHVGHLLKGGPAPAALTTALASYGVLPTDTIADVMVKMGGVHKVFMP